MNGPARRVDRWLFAVGEERELALAHLVVTILIGLRIALGPYRELAGVPSALVEPVAVLGFLDHMPSLGVIVALQVVGTGAAVLAAFGVRRRWTFAIAWVCFLVLAGLRGSRGKILHNDVALVLAAVPFLSAPADARLNGARRGNGYAFPMRAALVVLACAYFFAGWQKVLTSGASWVTGDNMRWILYTSSLSSRTPMPGLSEFIADRAWLAHVSAAAVMTLELTFPLALVWARARPFIALGAVGLHVGTYLTLGLDYWTWATLAVLLLVDWRPVLARWPVSRPS